MCHADDKTSEAVSNLDSEKGGKLPPADIDLPADAPEPYVRLVSHCLQGDPKARPNFSQIVRWIQVCYEDIRMEGGLESALFALDILALNQTDLLFSCICISASCPPCDKDHEGGLCLGMVSA